MYLSAAFPLSFLALAIGSTQSLAATPEQAKAFSETAAAHIREVGQEKALADFMRRDGAFIDGDLHVFCYDRDGINKADGSNPAFVGRNLLHIKDPDGGEPVALIVKTGFEQGDGWADFNWPNPVSKKIQSKSAYLIRTSNVVCGVGYYKE